MKKLKTTFFLFAILSYGFLTAMPNICVPTLGGMQFWDDVQISNGHRIQQHVWTGHYRLLNANNIRLAWGRLDHCRKIIPTDHNTEKPLILLIHGMGRSRYSMTSLQHKLQQEGYTAETFAYSSLLNSVDHFSSKLKNVIDLRPEKKIYCITHSLGGIILRHLDQTVPSSKIKGAITLAAPHQGSVVVDSLAQYNLHFLLGPTGSKLQSNQFLLQNTPLSFPLHTVAGVPKDKALLPFGLFLDGESDGIVLERNTHHPYSSSHTKVHASHTFIMNHPKVIEKIQQIIDSIK